MHKALSAGRGGGRGGLGGVLCVAATCDMNGAADAAGSTAGLVVPVVAQRAWR